ncbi:MAG TPA: RICIN domain-containing protein, partial [Polyangia bacterium]
PVLFAAVAAGCNGTVSVPGAVGAAIGAGAVYNFGTLAHPGACMDAAGGGTANGTQIQEWWCNGTGAQAFTVENAGGGAYTLVNPHSGKCVDVNARGTANGTKIQLWDCNGTPAQTFFVQPVSGGFVQLVNTSSGKCLDVAGDNPADGTVVQLYDCNGTNAQKWNPAVIGGGGGGGGSTGGGGGGNGMRVHVANGCPVDVWIHGAGAEGTLQPDNAHLGPGGAVDYVAPATWSAARIYAFLSPPDGNGNPQGQNDKVEMNFGVANGVETINTDITYVDWVALPTQIQAIGSGSDCTTVGCEVSYGSLLDGCPSSLRTGHECLSAGAYCSNPANGGDPMCHALDGNIGACASSTPGCGGAAGSTTAQVYSCSGGFFSQSPQFCAALNRGVLGSPGPGTPPSAFYQSPPYNPYAAWVHQRCPGIYAFPYDDYGASNQSSDHTCAGATQLNVTFCPRG